MMWKGQGHQAQPIIITLSLHLRSQSSTRINHAAYLNSSILRARRREGLGELTIVIVSARLSSREAPPRLLVTTWVTSLCQQTLTPTSQELTTCLCDRRWLAMGATARDALGAKVHKPGRWDSIIRVKKAIGEGLHQRRLRVQVRNMEL